MTYEWPDAKYSALVSCSQALFNNKDLLPVAAWLAEHDPQTVQAPEIERGLGGRSTRVLPVLERLCEAGFLDELPYLGRPHPRTFQPRPSAFWRFAQDLPSELNWANPDSSRT
jgi:hypothetical protein